MDERRIADGPGNIEQWSVAEKREEERQHIRTRLLYLADKLVCVELGTEKATGILDEMSDLNREMAEIAHHGGESGTIYPGARWDAILLMEEPVPEFGVSGKAVTA